MRADASVLSGVEDLKAASRARAEESTMEIEHMEETLTLDGLFGSTSPSGTSLSGFSRGGRGGFGGGRGAGRAVMRGPGSFGGGRNVFRSTLAGPGTSSDQRRLFSTPVTSPEYTPTFAAGKAAPPRPPAPLAAPPAQPRVTPHGPSCVLLGDISF